MGNPDSDIFAKIDFEAETESYESRSVAPIVNQAGILRIDEAVNAGDLVTIELRHNHMLKDIVLDPKHSMQILTWKNETDWLVVKEDFHGLIYWMVVGVTGTLSMTGKLFLDTDGFRKRLVDNLEDSAYREYLTSLYRIDLTTGEAPRVAIRQVMNHAEASDYLRMEQKTLYDHPEIPRLRGNKYRKSDLDAWLNSTGKSGKRRRHVTDPSPTVARNPEISRKIPKTKSY
jgi:hypothetical protein